MSTYYHVTNLFIPLPCLPLLRSSSGSGVNKVTFLNSSPAAVVSKSDPLVYLHRAASRYSDPAIIHEGQRLMTFYPSPSHPQIFTLRSFAFRPCPLSSLPFRHHLLLLPSLRFRFARLRPFRPLFALCSCSSSLFFFVLMLSFLSKFS